MISAVILTVIINQVIPLNPLHCLVLLSAQTRSPRWRGDRSARRRCIGRAPSYFEVSVPWNKRLEPVVCLILPIFRGPWRCIPNRAIHPHRSIGKHCLHLPLVPPNWHIVDEKSTRIRRRLNDEFTIDNTHSPIEHSHYFVGVPQNGIVVEVGGWVKPEVEPHLPPNDPAISTAPHIDISLQSVGLSRGCAKELNVHLVVVSRVSLVVR